VSARARDRLGLVAFVYGYRAVAAGLMALPITLLVGRAVASYPRAARELFDPGAVMLVEALRLARRGLVATLGGAAGVGLVALALSVIPLGALLAGLARDDRMSSADLAAASVRHAPTLALVALVGALGQGISAGVVLVVGGKLVAALASTGPAEDRQGVAVVALALVAASVVGVLRDLASVAAVREELRFYSACSVALGHARKRGGRLLFSWAWRTLLGLAWVVVAAVAAPPGATLSWHATAVAFALHQAAMFGLCLAHASWLAAAMRVVEGDGQDS
jgi:hypothetical protein